LAADEDGCGQLVGKCLEFLNAAPTTWSESMIAVPTERYLAIKVVMMPRDTNPMGTIFGGVLLSFIDQAGVVGALWEIRKAGWPDPRLVTVAMNAVEFHEPVLVGDIVSFWTKVMRVGKTSIAVHVVVETERDRQTVKLTQAEVVYVAIDETGPERRPRPLCPA
jgi:acyl-CoA thioesterase YciA